MSWRSLTVFYQQLGVAAKAGITLSEALRLAGANAPGRYRAWAPDLAAACERGGTLAAELRERGERPLVVALIDAGERSARLPEVCEEIVGFYRLAIEMRGMLVVRSIYPLLLLHGVMVLPVLAASFWGALSPWWIPVGPAVFWALVAAACLAIRYSARVGLLGRIACLQPFRLLVVPLVVTNTCSVLNAGLGAGMLASEALELAAEACGNRVFGEALHARADRLQRGETADLATALAAAGLPDFYVAFVRTGEVGGSLEQQLAHAADLARESFRSRVDWTCRAISWAVYGLAALAVLAYVVGMGYYLYVHLPRQILSEM